MSRGLPSKGDIGKLSEAGDELDNAFDTIVEGASGKQQGMGRAPGDVPSAAQSSKPSYQLASNDDLATYSDAGNELDSAFDSAFDSAADDQISALDANGNPIDAAHGSASETTTPDGASPDAVYAIESDSYYGDDAVEEVDDDVLEYASDMEVDEPEFDFAASSEKAWHGCRPYNGSSTLRQRLGRCTALANVRAAHAAALPEKEQELRQRLVKASQDYASLEGLTLEIKQQATREVELKRTLNTLEKEFLKYETRIATSWLRGPYLELHLDSATKTSYFESLVLRADLSPAWWDRVTLLALASATTREADGRLSLLSVEKLAPLWDGMLPDSKMAASAIGSSVQFFEDAIGRLRELQSVHELFSTGFYLDVVGYQISLRAGFFRPEVLYACAGFHTELSNWLNDPKHRVLSSTREAAISNVYAEARSIFKSQFRDDDAAARLRARLRGEKIKREQAAKRLQYAKKEKYGKRARAAAKKRATLRRRVILAVASVGVIFAFALPLGTEYKGERDRDLKPMSVRAVSDIHPLLISGTYGREASVVVAQIDGDEWVLLSDAERADVAQEMLRGAHDAGVKHLMVYYLDMLVLQIVDGELRYVE